MLKFFPEIGDVPAHTSFSLIRQFAIALAARLDAQDLISIHALHMSLYERDNELREQQKSIIPSLRQAMITKGAILTIRSPVDDDERITLASLEQVREYYRQLAEIVIERKKGSCVGLAAVALALSSDLIAESQYQHIEVQLIQLHHWGHALIRLTHPAEQKSLFYDPWYQRCQSPSNPIIPMLMEESELATQMDRLVIGDVLQGIPTIRHLEELVRYDPKKRQLLDNRDQSGSSQFGYSYCILCSSGRFSNPSNVMTEPEGKGNTMSPSSVCVVS